MKNKQLLIIFILLVSVSLAIRTFLNKYNKDIYLSKIDVKNELNSNGLNTRNESILVKTLLLNKWLIVPQIYKSSYDTLRCKLISEIVDRTAIPEKKLIKLLDEELSSIALTYGFFLKAEIKTVKTLKLMSRQDLLQILIEINKKKTTYLTSYLKDFSMEENLRIAYQWWLPQKNASLIIQINEIVIDKSYFQVKDNHQRAIEVLKIVKADEDDFKYLGVYHSMVSKNHFKLYLAGSNDLKSWIRITSLGDRLHQGDIKKWGNGYLLVNEEDKKEGSNNIKVRFYESYKDLCANQSKNNISLSRTFSSFAEGTPDIREIYGKTPEDSHLLFGFHYFNNKDVDYQAIGILKDFKAWKAWKDIITDKNIIEMGFKGNIGGRYSFNNQGQTYVLQEAQIKKNDFSTWRLLIGTDAHFTKLNIKTPKGSTSFANPSITKIENEAFVISTFLPTEGNRKRENGQLIYTFKHNEE
jgi:hypothetical protein